MAAMVCLNAAVLWNNRQDIAAGRNDFPIFYSNAQMVHEGKAAALYDFEAEQRFARTVSDRPAPPNNHLPYELLLFIPFIYLPFRVAYILWTILGLAMLAGVAGVMRNARAGNNWSFAFTLLTILSFYPVWNCLIAGQDSILLLLLFTISFWLWKRRKDDMAGAVLALGLFRPQLVLPFVLAAFLGGKWKFVRGFVPGAALVLTLSASVVGLHGMADYARLLLSQGTQGSAPVLANRWHVTPGLMPTWRGFLWLCLPRWIPPGAQTALLLSGTILGLGWAARKMRTARGSRAFEMAFAITLATVLLVSFHSFLQDFSLMVLPLLICSQAFSASRIVAKKSASLIVSLCFLLFLTPLYLILFATETMGWLFLVGSLALWLVSRRANDWRTETSNAITVAPECSVTT
jgi:hypothetical protein